uniref:Uncharacterized protein n=1 Tax=Anguilla anguilla TaxID=7936 RepID=A0A0E9UZM3_ANGAN
MKIAARFIQNPLSS